MNTYPDLLSSSAQMVLALLFVLAGLLGVYYLARRYLAGRAAVGNHRLIQVAASAAVGFKKYISVVDVAGEYLVLGISDQNICLLSRLENPESIALLKEKLQHKTSPGFAEHLQMFSSKLKELHHGK